MLDFEPVTILYGGNGSGKTTALNVIAEKLELENLIPKNSRIITSDDVFDFMLNLRSINEGINQKREDLFEEYLDAKYAKFQMRSLDDYEQLKKVNMARSKTQ